MEFPLLWAKLYQAMIEQRPDLIDKIKKSKTNRRNA